MGHSKQRLFKKVERINREQENLEGQKRRKLPSIYICGQGFPVNPKNSITLIHIP